MGAGKSGNNKGKRMHKNKTKKYKKNQEFEKVKKRDQKHYLSEDKENRQTNIKYSSWKKHTHQE